MYVLVDDRQKGKTTKLVHWLLDGEERANYPGWSRVIVCPARGRVVFVTDMVKKLTQDEWDHCTLVTADNTLADAFTATGRRLRQLGNIRKAVWSLDDLRQNSFGGRLEVFDYALDDVDHFLAQLLRVHKMPERITMTGETWT